MCARSPKSMCARGILYTDFLSQTVERSPEIASPVGDVFRRSGKCVYAKNLTNPAKCGCKSVDSDRSAEMSATGIPGGRVSNLRGHAVQD